MICSLLLKRSLVGLAYCRKRGDVSKRLDDVIKQKHIRARKELQEYGNPGSCGFGAINETTWPFGALIAVQSNNTIVKNLPNHGCGTCFTISCADKVAFLKFYMRSGQVVLSCTPWSCGS